MKVTFLGTGTSHGVPVVGCCCKVCQSLDYRDKRLRTSLHIKVEDKSIIIDTGPDFRQQVLQNRISTLDALLFTHEHKDHVAGMDDIRGFNYKQGKAIPLYARQRVINQLKKEYQYIFEDDKTPGLPKIDTNVIDKEPFYIHGIKVTPVDAMHYRLPVLGFRIGQLAYITDASFVDQNEIAKLDGIDVLVINALQKEPHISHFNLEQAIAMVELIQPREAYFIHISHKLGLHKEVSQELPDHIHLAYDGLTLDI